MKLGGLVEEYHDPMLRHGRRAGDVRGLAGRDRGVRHQLQREHVHERVGKNEDLVQGFLLG